MEKYFFVNFWMRLVLMANNERTSAVSIPKYFEPDIRNRSIKIRDMSVAVVGAGSSLSECSISVLCIESFL